jgi:hypothetical protein
MSTHRNIVLNARPPQTIDAGIFADIRFDPNDSAPDYIGLHITNGADTSALDWRIYKFTYIGSDATRIQMAIGAWDNRISLF